jgi:hypothetical protein
MPFCDHIGCWHVAQTHDDHTKAQQCHSGPHPRQIGALVRQMIARAVRIGFFCRRYLFFRECSSTSASTPVLGRKRPYLARGTRRNIDCHSLPLAATTTTLESGSQPASSASQSVRLPNRRDCKEGISISHRDSPLAPKTYLRSGDQKTPLTSPGHNTSTHNARTLRRNTTRVHCQFSPSGASRQTIIQRRFRRHRPIRAFQKQHPVAAAPVFDAKQSRAIRLVGTSRTT